MAKSYWKDWSKKPPNQNKLSRFSVKWDKYDREDFLRLLNEMKEFKSYREKLADSEAGDLAYDAWQDFWLLLMKVTPEMEATNKVKPENLITHRVAEEAVDLAVYKELRLYTQGDDIGAALAVNTMEPDLETLYDRLKEERKMAEELAELMQQMAEANKEQRDLESMIKAWTDDDPDGEPRDWSAEQQSMQDKIDALQQQIADTGMSLDEAMNNAAPEIRAVLKAAMRQAADDVDNMNSMAESWGMEPGTLHRLPAQDRIALAKRLNSPKFKRIAELFGPMKRLAFAEQRRKVNYAPEEIFDVELGNNIPRLLPTEFGKLAHPLRQLQFFKDYMARNLMQYKMRGFEKVAKGGIIYLHDGSGSMGGEREMWAKAVGLCLLHIARKQKRQFVAIQFGSRGQLMMHDFRDGEISPERVIDFAEFFYGGGTDFEGPLNAALTLLNEENAKTGALKSDIVFATDGMCAVSAKWMANFMAEKKRLNFKCWGINIGGRVKDQPMYEICDGLVASISSLTSGENVREIFGNV